MNEIISKLELIEKKITKEFPNRAYIGKNYTIQDLINDLNNIKKEL